MIGDPSPTWMSDIRETLDKGKTLDWESAQMLVDAIDRRDAEIRRFLCWLEQMASLGAKVNAVIFGGDTNEG